MPRWNGRKAVSYSKHGSNIADFFLRSRQRHCGNMSGGNQQIATSVLRYAIELGVDDIMRIAITIFL